MNAKQKAALDRFAAYFASEGPAEIDARPIAHGEIAVTVRQPGGFRNFNIGARGGVFFRPATSERRGVYSATEPSQIPVERFAKGGSRWAA